MIYTIYLNDTGEILKTVQTDNIDSQIQPGESYVEGSIDSSFYYIKDNVAVEIPPKTSPYAVFNFTTKQWVLVENLAITDVLSKRQKLLYSSDWTQLPNGPLTQQQQEAWVTYRQALRDITDQSGFPTDVVWPTRP